MMKKRLIFAVVFAVLVYGQCFAQEGWLIRPDCSALSPVNEKTVCLQTTTAGGREPGLYLYSNNSWVSRIGGASKALDFDYTALPSGTTTVIVPSPNPVFVKGIANPNDSLCVSYIDQNGVQQRTPCGLGVSPVVGFATASSNGGEATTSVSIPVSLLNGTGATVTVNYAATGGTATGGGVDYTLASGTLTFSGATTSQNIVITVINDATVESAETIQITLSSPSGASLGTSVHTYTINDNDSGGGSITHVASGAKGSTNAQTVDLDPLDSTGATFGVFCTGSIGNLTVADNRSGTWTEIELQGGGTELRMWTRSGGTYGTNTIVSVTNNGTRYPSGAVGFYSGATNVSTRTKSTGDGVTTISPGSITPAAANNLMIACLAAGNVTGTTSIGSSYTIRGQVTYVDGQRMTVALADLIQTSATAQNPQWTVANNSSLRAMQAAVTP